MTQITRWYDLLLWKINIPNFILNCNNVYEEHTLAFVKESFSYVDRVMVLSAKGDIEQLHRKVNVQWAVHVSIQLESKGHTVLIAEDPEVEYNGVVWLYTDGAGYFQIGRKREKMWFTHYSRMEDLRLRYVFRLLYDFLLKIKCPGIRVDFAWATEMTGILGSRYLVYDFQPLGKMLDNKTRF